VYDQPRTSVFGPLVLYEYLEGEMWGRRRPSAAELGQLANVWLQVSAISAEGLWLSRGYKGTLQQREAGFLALFQAYAAWAEMHFHPAMRALDLCFGLMERCRAVARELDECEPLLCFCKSDPRFANVIRRPDGRLGLVDWEDSGLRDPARDLADVMTHPYQEDLLALDDWQALLEPYLAVRGEIDLQLARRVQLYLAIYPVFWLATSIRTRLQATRSGRVSRERSHGMLLNDRLRRYLARGLAWPEPDFAEQLEALADVVFFPTFQPADLPRLEEKR
jgi:thiamine kinase-like enzyme